MGVREENIRTNKQTMIETQTTLLISNPPTMEDEKSEVRFPGQGNTCGEWTDEEYAEYEQEVSENDCVICGECDCQSEKCEMEIERQECMAEYWADF